MNSPTGRRPPSLTNLRPCQQSRPAQPPVVPPPKAVNQTRVYVPGKGIVQPSAISGTSQPAVMPSIPQHKPQPPVPPSHAVPPAPPNNLPATSLFDDPQSELQYKKESLIGKCLDNRYEIVSHIASGGMSEIYLAIQRGIGQQVVVKKLHPYLYEDKNAVKRFIDEARTYAALTHPNAVKMYDLLDVNGQICLIMEYVAGKTLMSYLESGFVFSIRQILDIAMQLADALGTVHKVGIIHRDLKSENIMLMETVGERFSVKILDFGIAKIKNSSNVNLTQEGAVVGSPKYMSPEQSKGSKNIDGRADIYSFGILLYEMICGRLPFEGDSTLVVLHQQLFANVP